MSVTFTIKKHFQLTLFLLVQLTYIKRDSNGKNVELVIFELLDLKKINSYHNTTTKYNQYHYGEYFSHSLEGDCHFC